jgi:hypothetical protein
MKNKNLKIIHSCTSHSFSGLERYVVELASWQNSSKIDVLVFCRKNTEIFRQCMIRSIPVWAIGEHEKKGPLLWTKMAFSWSKIFKEATKKNQNLILHMHAGGEPWFHLPWLMVRAKNLKKIILQYHLWINHKKKDPFHKALFSKIDEIWCSSNSAKEHLLKLLPKEESSFKVIPYGRDIKKVLEVKNNLKLKEQYRKNFKIPLDACVGVCVSRIEPIKGIQELIHSFIKVANEYTNFYLILVGAPSPQDDSALILYKKIEDEIKKLNENIKSRLILTGNRSDYLEIMSAGDFYILPSYEECMSLAMLDALILGLPVLGTNSGGTPSVVKNNINGFIFEPRSEGSLTQALKKIIDIFLNDKDKFLKLKKETSFAEQEFNQEKIFKKILNFYS